MAKRLIRKLTDVIHEVKNHLISDYGLTQESIDSYSRQGRAHGYEFPHCSTVNIDDLWIDYEIQRDVLYKHIINIMKKWDPRLCSAGSACQFIGDNRKFLYDAQHRTIAASILGYLEIPCALVITDDPNFPSYAFLSLNKTGVERLSPGDLHRNYLVRYKNGVRDIKATRARVMQNQFDLAEIDLQDKKSRKNANLCGDHLYFFSHFNYAYKGIEVDLTGKILFDILTAIKKSFPLQEEIDQGVFIGLLELYKLSGTEINKLTDDWMLEVLSKVKKSFKSSHIVHSKARAQWDYINPGATWSAPSAMSNFLREVYIYNGGKLKLPYHGEGSKMGIEKRIIAPGLFPEK
jgi:hypothetical protein